ncbi:hypothetical protein E4O04_12255 [Treponema sp. OMZ 799]|uniref:hypothetical protein n=1 Tax=Treponema sp. OMZ 799 TaxID=2563668 RepID=UPI0020A5E162|nr:hypothetical protein [Treponema sp. OMZ 799]UTC78722.1 hypothetical protein E4O04_12255 [Treponema sp. OMZ 799]
MELKPEGTNQNLKKILKEGLIYNIVLFSPNNPKIAPGVTYIPSHEEIHKTIKSSLKWKACWYSNIIKNDEECYILYNYTLPHLSFYSFVQNYKKEYFIVVQNESSELVYYLYKVKAEYPPFKLTKEEQKELKQRQSFEIIYSGNSLKDLHTYHNDKDLKLIEEKDVADGAFAYTQKIMEMYSEGPGLSLKEGKEDIAEMVSTQPKDSMSLYFERNRVQWGGKERWQRNDNAEGSRLKIYRFGSMCFFLNFSKKK